MSFFCPVEKKNMCPHTSSHKSVTLLLWLFLFCTLHRGAFCQFLYSGFITAILVNPPEKKSGKMHLCALDEEAIPTQSSGKNGKQIRAELSKSFCNFYSAQCTMGPKITLSSQFPKIILTWKYLRIRNVSPSVKILHILFMEKKSWKLVKMYYVIN